MLQGVGIVSLVICLVTTYLWWYFKQKQKQDKDFIVTLTVLSGCAVLLLPVIAVATGVCTLIAFYWQAKGG
jgi:nitrogen fixation-related uncharacterized protein